MSAATTEALMQTLAAEVLTAEALEASGKYREAADRVAQALTVAYQEYVQTQTAAPTLARPPPMPMPRRSYVERYKRRLRVDWEKWDRVSRRPVPQIHPSVVLPRGEGGGDEDEDEEGDEEAEAGDCGAGSSSSATHRTSSWQPRTLQKNWSGAVDAEGSRVEIVHTCADGTRVTVVVAPPAMPARANHMFNADAKRTVKALHEGDAELTGGRAYGRDELASWFLVSDKLSKNKLGDYLGRSDELPVGIMSALLARLDFGRCPFDEALRFFLSLFRLPGEAQQIDRIMEAFAKRYTECHPAEFKSPDTAYVLAFSVIMLNTDAHSPQIVNKMSLDDFLKNNRGIGENGGDMDPQVLTRLYHAIVANEIRLEQREFISSVQEGWLLKQGGRIKTWKRRYTILSGNVLYYFKTPKDFSPAGFIPLENVAVARSGHMGFELRPAGGEKAMKSVHMAKDKGAGGKGSKGGARFESGHHKSFHFRVEAADELEDWVQAIQQYAVAAPTPPAPHGREVSTAPSRTSSATRSSARPPAAKPKEAGAAAGSAQYRF